MLRDAGGSLWGTLVFALALLSPGYCLGHWLELDAAAQGGFRRRGLREQMAWSVVLSFAATLPLVAVVWLGGMLAAEVVLVAIGVLAVVLFLRNRPVVDVSRREALVWGSIGGAWVVVVIFSLIDVGTGARLFMSVTSYDHGLRTAFVDAVMRTGVVPVNPVYWPGHDTPLRYYYFWYVTCGVVGRIAHISARQALVASCVWPVVGVGAMLALYGRYLLGWRGEVLWRRWGIGVALLSVTGLDLPVVIFNRLAGGTISGDMEWWSIDMVTSWVDTFLWVPHHAAALVCCLLCLLLLWMASGEVLRKQRVAMAAIAGVSFAGAFGLSTYVAVATAGIVGCWVVWRLFCEGRVRLLAAAGIAALVAGLALGPYVAQLMQHEAGQTQQTARHVLGLGVREMLDPEMLLPLFQRMQRVHPVRAREIVALILLVPGYAIELGFFAVVLWLAQRQREARSNGESTLLFWAWSGLAVASFVRSQVIVTNDYGMRASLLLQFFLLLLGIGVLAGSSGWLRKALLGLAAIGVCGSIYQVAMLRTFVGWSEAHGDPAMRELAERNYALRDAYAALQGRVPREARVQYDSAAGGYFVDAQMLNVGHQVIAEQKGCNVSFGGEMSACAAVGSGVDQLFPGPGQRVPAAADAAGLCQGLGVEYLVATQWDEAWKTPEGWVWHLPAVVERPGVRVVMCTAFP